MKNKKTSDFFMKYGVPLVLLAVVLIIQAANPTKALLGSTNLSLIISHTSVLGLIALGLCLIMIVGEIDMSIAGIIGFLCIVFSKILRDTELGPVLSFLIILGMGVGFAILASSLVVRLKVSSFIVTVVLMFVTMGADKAVNKGKPIWLEHDGMRSLGSEVLGITVLAWILIAAYIIWFFVVNKTKFGFHLRITGENEQAAREVGVRTGQIKIMAFVFAGVLYALAALIEPVRSGGATIYAGEPYLLPAMAACFLGSTMFKPGHVNVIGTFVGALFMMLIWNFMTFLGVIYYLVPIIQGGLLLASVIFANMHSREIKQNKM